MTTPTSGFLLIADITGYTAYLSASELEHAQGTLTALLELLIEHTRPPLIISRLAGDAVISYGLQDQFMQGQTAQKGDHIFITHIPNAGLHCSLAGKGEVLIKNAQFARAVWDIYLGKNNLGDEIKKGLVSRL